MCGTYGGAKPIVFGRNGVGYTSLREYIKPCKVISHVKLAPRNTAVTRAL